MKSKEIIIPLFVCFWILANSFNFSQTKGKENLLMQKQLADSLFNIGNFYDSITEYKRLIYFDKKRDFYYVANLRIALAYKYGGFLNYSENHFQTAIYFAKTKRDKELAEIELAKTYIFLHHPSQALNLLDSIEPTFTNTNEINYWRAWAYLFSGSLNLARKYFIKSKANKILIDKTKIYSDSLYSVSTAKMLSYLLPGAGQFYTGEYFSGAISFLWNTLSLYLTINAFISERILEGFFIGDLLWLRFYRGNIYNAEKFAKEKNVKFINRFLNDLQKNYKGKKP